MCPRRLEEISRNKLSLVYEILSYLAWRKVAYNGVWLGTIPNVYLELVDGSVKHATIELFECIELWGNICICFTSIFLNHYPAYRWIDFVLFLVACHPYRSCV